MKRYQFQIILAGTINAEASDIADEKRVAQASVDSLISSAFHYADANTDITSTSGSMVLRPESPLEELQRSLGGAPPAQPLGQPS